MKPTQLEQLLPEIDSITEMIYYNSKANIVNKLSNGLWLKNDSSYIEIETLKKDWENLKPRTQQEIIAQYKKSDSLNILSSLFINDNLKALENTSIVLDFLLSSGFCLSNKDQKDFKQNNWLAYKEIYGGKVYQVHWYSIFYTYGIQLYDIVTGYIKKLLGMKEEACLYIIEYYPDQFMPILIKHMNKLPKPLKEKLLRELSNEKLMELNELTMVGNK